VLVSFAGGFTTKILANAEISPTQDAWGTTTGWIIVQ
jgi:hypothetical protein